MSLIPQGFEALASRQPHPLGMSILYDDEDLKEGIDLGINTEEVLQAAYPRHVASSRRKNVVLIIVDSLRADHMQVYGYQLPTTPFLSSMVKSGPPQQFSYYLLFKVKI